MEINSTHCGFTDESAHNIGRFRAVGIVSMPTSQVNKLSIELRSILQQSGFHNEFKWQEVKDAKGRFAGRKCIDFSLRHCSSKSLRIDIVTWDINDSRHFVPRRDDSANLERMYYHLFKFVVCQQWPAHSSWLLFPDENPAINWDALREFLNLKSGTNKAINKIEPIDSKHSSLVQLADFFAGMCRYSREKFVKIDAWQKKELIELKLFDNQTTAFESLSGSDEERCVVVNNLNERCKYLKMGVSLNTHSGLRTLDSSYPINFWWYEPQHEKDKAPQRA